MLLPPHELVHTERTPYLQPKSETCDQTMPTSDNQGYINMLSKLISQKLKEFFEVKKSVRLARHIKE